MPGEFVNPLSPISEAKQPVWGQEWATHLLNRAGFGGTEQEIAALAAMTPQAAVQSVVRYQSIPDPLPEMQFGDLSGATDANARNLRLYFRDLTEEQRKSILQLKLIAGAAKVREMKLWWLDRMVRTRRPLEEKMTLLWHGLFVSTYATVRDTYHLYMQNQLLRSHATGNIKALTMAISRDPAMLEYLSNNQNKKEHPNENYARELMELFTMGIGNYTEQDIKESARAFTGWTYLGDTFVFNAREHDFGTKTFLGRKGEFDGADIVDIIFDHPATPRHFAERLLKFFAVDVPPPEVISALGDEFLRNKWQIGPTLETLFASQYFYSPDVMRTQVKSPVQLVAGALRLLKVDVPDARAVDDSLKLMAQELFNAPNVKGWDGGRAWINTSTLFVRYNLPAYLVTGKLPAAGKKLAVDDNGNQRFAEFISAWDPQLDLAEGRAVTTDAVVDLYVRKLLQQNLDPKKREELLTFLNGTGDARSILFDPVDEHAPDRTRTLVHLIMSMPEFQIC